MFNIYAQPIWSEFNALVIAPVRNTRDEGDAQTEVEICSTSDLEGWTIYGQQHSGAVMAILDAMTIEALIKPLLSAVAASSLPVVYHDEDRRTPPSSLCDLCDRLAEIIHDDVDTDAEDDLEARDDDFEAHPLCELRQSIGETCGYFGIEAEGPDVYDALRQCVHNLEQMEGMFSDEDGTIKAAIAAGHAALDAKPPS